MEWAAVLRDIVIGLLIAGAAAAWIPDAFWQGLFFTDHPVWARIWGPLIGPLVAVAAFVCSIGNVPLAAVLWNGGISFGGVVSFVFADLIIVPLIVIYAKYYGRRMALKLTAIFYVTMVVAGYVVELVFTPLHLAPSGARHASIGMDGVRWNYTSWLNIVVPAARRRARRAVLPDRWAAHALDDGRRVRTRWNTTRTHDSAQPLILRRQLVVARGEPLVVVLQREDPADPGEIHPVVEQVGDAVQPIDVVRAVEARAAGRPRGLEQPAPLVQAAGSADPCRRGRPRPRSRRRRWTRRAACDAPSIRPPRGLRNLGPNATTDLCRVTQILGNNRISSTDRRRERCWCVAIPSASSTGCSRSSSAAPGATSGPAGMAVDAWREGDAFFLALDLPGVSADSIDLDIDRNVLSVRAERTVKRENMVLGRAALRDVQPPVHPRRHARPRPDQGELRGRRPDAADPGCRAGEAAQDHGQQRAHAVGGDSSDEGRVLEGTAS